MATVDFKIKNLKGPDGTKGTLAEIAGSIDATSIVQFQNVMDKLVEKGVKNLILDCASVKYINSTGLGTLLKYVDTFESVDGHIAFTRVPSKVMLVMEMLGFNALFTIVPDEAAALRLFGGGAAQPAPAAPAAAGPSISPPAQAMPSISKPAAPAGAGSPTIVIPPGQLPGIGPAPKAPAAPQPAPARGAGPDGYPAASECLRCGITLDVGGPGKYKCPRCMSVVVAEPGGKVRFFAPKKARPVSVTLPAQPELIDGVGMLAEGVARQAGFDGPSAGLVRQAVAAASRGVLETAYGGDTSGLIHLIMSPDGDSLTVRISDYGNPIPAEGGVPTAASFAPVTQIMDSVVIKPNPKRGNLLTLTKSVG